MPYMREDQFRILVQVVGPNGPILDTVPWQVCEGGEVQSSSTNTHPGNMTPPVDLGGPSARSDVTVKRLYSPDVLHPIVPALEQAVGNGKFTVSYTPLDVNKNPDGQTIVLTGVLKSVLHPNYDANATAAAVLSLTAGMNLDSSVAGN